MRYFSLYSSDSDVIRITGYLVKKVKSFISGITVSGGECTLQLEFLTELFKEVKKLGLTTSADTNGYIPFSDKKGFLEVLDKAMLDVKF